MNIGVLYVITTIVCLLEIIIIINRINRTKYRETIDPHFSNMLYFFAFFCSVDLLWGFFSSQLVWISQTGFTVVSYGFHSVAALSAYIWFGYIMYYIKAKGAEWAVLNYLRHILLIIQMIVLSSNFFTHDAFWVDEYCNYYTGKLRTFLYLLQYSYYIILIVYTELMFIKKKYSKKYSDAFLFSLIPLGFGILQYIFYDAALYSIGFMFSAFIIYSFNVTTQREEFMEARLFSLDKKQSSIISGLAGDFEAIYYVDINSGDFEIYKRDGGNNSLIKEKELNSNYFDSVLEHGSKMVLRQELDDFMLKFTKKYILEQIEANGSYTNTIRLRRGGRIKYFKYKFILSTPDDDNRKMIVGVYDVDYEVRKELKRQEEERAFSLDAMTGLFNRRMYEADVANITRKPLKNDFVYVSLDLNELKAINDSLGHEAGDELISAAASCISNVFSDTGKIYRVGGDEFVALVYVDKECMDELIEVLKESMEKWSGKYFETLSISYGYSTVEEFPNSSFKELAGIADKRMYANKAKHYADKGVDRKGQQEAYSAVCNSYTKILKVNLTEDNFRIIQMDLSEKTKSKGYSNQISKWLHDFAVGGCVYKDDVEFFLAHTNLEYLREHFSSGNRFMCIYYRRLMGDEYRRFMLEMIPASEYTDEEQILFLYVKNIDR